MTREDASRHPLQAQASGNCRLGFARQVDARVVIEFVFGIDLGVVTRQAKPRPMGECRPSRSSQSNNRSQASGQDEV